MSNHERKPSKSSEAITKAAKQSKKMFFMATPYKSQLQYQGETIFAWNRVHLCGTNKLYFQTFPAMQTQLHHKEFSLYKL